MLFSTDTELDAYDLYGVFSMDACHFVSMSYNNFGSLLDILQYRSLQRPESTSYIFLENGETESVRLTYGELDRRARAIASHLQSWQGQRALLLYPSGLEFITAFLGCLYAGVVAVPVYPPRRNQKLHRLLSIVNDAQAKVALTTTSILADIEKRCFEEAELAQLNWVATDTIEDNPLEFVPKSVTPESLAFLQYTSGSTGTPKGVMVTHGNIIHNQQLIHQAFGHSEKTIFVGWLPLFHDMGLIGNVLQPLYLGIPSILMPPFAFLQQPVRWLSAISRYKATTSGGPNFAYDLCVKKVQPEQLANLDLSSWDLAFNGAEPVRAETLKQFAEKFAPSGFNYSAFYPCYGMAETTLFTTGGDKNQKPVIQGVKARELEQNSVVENEISSPLSRVFVGCGRPYMDTTVIIVNPESLTDCEKGTVGEIWVEGGSIASGYWNRPEATQETFQGYLKDTGDGPFLRTGDLGFFRNGELFVTGRLKDVIIISGRNHYPQDIELTVENSHPALQSHCSAAFSIEMEDSECLVVACEVERTYLRKLNTLEVVRAIQIAVSTEHELEVYGVVLLKTGSIPKTSSGKIQRRACKLGFLEESLNVVGQWQKTLENNPTIIGSNSQINSQDFSLHKLSKTVGEIEAWLANKIAEILQISPQEIELKQPLAVYGLNSVKAVSIAAELEKWLGISIAPTIVYDYPSIQALADYLGQTTPADKSSTFVSNQKTATEAVAIIGMGCRFPKAKNPQAFWSLLREGIDAITKVPASRWESDNGWGGFLEQVDQFEPQFFSISPREANNMDPQQRLLLEVSWEALENAGLAAERLAGSRGGVFIGISSGDYAKLNGNIVNTEAYYGTGNALSIAANRLSYFLDWHGPSWAVDTACSSSLVAVHQACQSLLLGECCLALAGGVNLMLSPQLTLTFAEAQMMAADGLCKTFDALADGYVRSEGCGVVVLKRLADALADGDSIQAIIRGSAVNQDGLTNGLTAPNGNSQQEVIRLALAKAGVQPNQISYVETHGTGTALGDPIEVNSLKAVLMEDRESNQPCWIGSVKTNIGHLEAAAGIAGLIKVVLSFSHGEIPPHLHLKQLNPYIELEKTTIEIPTQLQPWSSLGQPRLAGVSAFGFGGTNAHVILEEAPTLQEFNSVDLLERPVHLLTLSAKTEKALEDLVLSYQNHLETYGELAIADVCCSANTGRSHFNHRLAIITSDKQELAAKLAKISAGEEPNGVFYGKLSSNSKSPKIAFLFTGQGSQYVNMGRQLYETQPVFRRALDQCEQILQSYLEKSLLEVIYPENPQESNSSVINETALTQPALFAIELALFQLWQSWGIKPDVVMGHSVGEYVAACVAGVFSLEDGLKLIAERARLMQNMPLEGEMVVVFASEIAIRSVTSIDVSKVAIAADNGPQNTVISGEYQAVRKICTALEATGIHTKKLVTSHAFHSPLMEPMLAEFRRVAASVTYAAPQIDIISNITGQRLTAQSINSEYWCHHLRSRVEFAKSLQMLHAAGYKIFVEIGPKPILLGMARKCLPEGDQVWLPSLRQDRGDWQQLLQSLGELYVRGVRVDWCGFDRDYSRYPVELPTYPFQRKRYWIPEQQSTMDEKQFGAKVGAKVSEREFGGSFKTHRRDAILSKLHSIITDLLKALPSEVDVHTPFLEIGADSLMLIDAICYVEITYGIKITIRQLFEELSTIYALACYIDQNLPPDQTSADAQPAESESQTQHSTQQTTATTFAEPTRYDTPGREENTTVAETALERIMMQQLQVVSQVVSQQLEILRGKGLSSESVSSSQKGHSQSAHQTTAYAVHVPDRVQHNQVQEQDVSSAKKLESEETAASKVEVPSAKELNQQQKQHLETLIAYYNKRTQKSKERAQAYRPVLADSRAVAGFRPSIKEMVYPIVGERSLGARFWDIDGNEYVDITMGFGVLLFGHAATFITAARKEQTQQGIEIGPQSNLSGEVAQLICELTGVQRVAFCNSGTEAVMTALRLARTATGRTKIALFAGSYHGHFDGVLAKALPGQFSAVPISPGISQHAIEDVLVLDYGEPKSIDILQAHAHELAAVLVEPVQGRRPDLQPKEFLQQLRRLTKAAGIALIFDEVLLGFRIHLGGAQAWFGIEADIVTYGKIIGGGIPIGVVAGKATYIDGIDGGSWNYGDTSYPQAEKTVFAGTFNKNHMGMAVARAVLNHLKNQGSTLQEQLNQRTSQFATTLNTYFEQEDVPIRIVHFGSLFRFAFSGNLDVLFYHLLSKGVYIWEGRNCFLSTAHTNEDINYIIQAVKDSVEALRAGGFLIKPSVKLFEKNTVQSTVAHLQQRATDKVDDISESSTPPLLPIVRDANLPLSLAQKRLWFLDQLEPNSAFYNIPTAVRLQGQLKVTALEESFKQIICRHEALRTNFISQNGQPLQIIHTVLSWTMSVVSLQHLPESEREIESQRLAITEAQRPFDLAKEPLLRVTLVVLSETEHILLLTMHHIVSDGWSMGIVVKELAALYSAFIYAQPSPLPELPIQYVDFAVWQRQWLQGDVLQSQLAYWKQQLNGAATILTLPTDRPRPSVQTVRGAHQSFALSSELSKALKLLSRQEGVTLFMTLLTAFGSLLYRYTGQADILVGSPIANRNRSEIQGLIGFFLNILLLRTDMSSNPSFRELLGRVRKVTLGAYEHQDVPFEELIEALQPVRDLSHTPLFQVMFILDNAIPMEEMQLPSLTWSAISVENFTSKLDLTLTLENSLQGLVGSWEYNTDLFDASTIKRMAEHFKTLLEGIVVHPEQRISELPLLTVAEQYQLLFEWNDTQREYPRNKCIHQIFEEQVERTPDAVALVFENQQLTYRELNCRANQLAYYLKTLGVGSDVLVGICVERSLAIIVGLLGVLKAGGAYVPLDPNYPQERLTYMLNNSRILLLLTTKNLVAQLPEHSARLVCLDTNWEVISTKSEKNPKSKVIPENLAYVIYTSGSTGTPKGVMVSHRSLVNAYSGWEDAYQLRARTSNHLQMANFSFDVFSGDMARALCSGAKLVICPRELLLAPEELYRLMREQEIDFAEFVPAVIRNLIEYLERTGQNLNFMRVLVVGSDSWYVKEYQEFQRFCGLETRLINSYGVSEATIDSCYFENAQVNLFVDELVPIGRPFGNTEIYILDSQLQPVPIGVPGELHIGGAGLADGYLNRPDLTGDKFIPHPFSNEPKSRLYKTGDLARYLKDGNIEFLGRIDNQVKIRGFRIELAEIEAVISQHSAVFQTVVIAREDIPGDKRLVAYLVPHQESALTTTDLRHFLKEKLPEYMVPSAFVMLEAMPLTPNGKVDRRALPVPDMLHSELKASFVAPQSPTEEMLAVIWADVLGVEFVGRYDNFFELGGHSLLATQVISRLRKTFCVELPLRCLFESPTIAELSDLTEIARRKQQSQTIPPIQPVDREGVLPLSFAQERLWFLDQLEGKSATYNLPVALRLIGFLDVAALELAVREIVRRHEALRTTFPMVKGFPVQAIAPVLSLTLPVVDLQGLPEIERETQMQQLATQDDQRPFDLSIGPLLRVTLLRLGEREHVVLLTMHHIISDAWSMGVFIQELTTLYKAFSKGMPSPLPEFSVQYADFAHWQRQWLSGEMLATQLQYWKQQLSGTLPILELPTDRPRPAVQSFRGGMEEFQINRELTKQLKTLSQQSGTTLFITLLAAFKTLLYRYTGQEDIIVGTDIANRNRAEIEVLIGFFVNQLVLRTDLSGNPTFNELLLRVQQMTLGAYTNQDLPFQKLVQELQPERSLSSTPLFQVKFILQNAPQDALELPDLTWSSLKVDNEEAQFDFLLSMKEETEELIGTAIYSTDLFEARSITRLLKHFQTLLESIITNPDQRLASLTMLTDAETDGQTLANFSNAHLSQKDFENLILEISKISEKDEHD